MYEVGLKMLVCVQNTGSPLKADGVQNADLPPSGDDWEVLEEGRHVHRKRLVEAASSDSEEMHRLVGSDQSMHPLRSARRNGHFFREVILQTNMLGSRRKSGMG